MAPVAIGQVPPWCSGAQFPQDRVDHLAVINAICGPDPRQVGATARSVARPYPSAHHARPLEHDHRLQVGTLTGHALDLASGQLFYRLRDREHWQEFLSFLRQLRARFPSGRLHIVCHNFPPHLKAEVAGWCAEHDVELVFTSLRASWLNWIESEFTALRYFTLDGSDYPSRIAQEAAIAGYIRWANRRARPKRHFATVSKIRRPDYEALA